MDGTTRVPEQKICGDVATGRATDLDRQDNGLPRAKLARIAFHGNAGTARYHTAKIDLGTSPICEMKLQSNGTRVRAQFAEFNPDWCRSVIQRYGQRMSRGGLWRSGVGTKRRRTAWSSIRRLVIAST